MLLKPKSIHIFLADGDPDGLRIAQLSMSTIQALAFRRNVLGDVRRRFPELERAGAYILLGPADEERQIAYVGESENLAARLAYHNANQNPKDSKPFWTDTIVLLSKDENLTKSHARYIEACLIRAASKSFRWTTPNNKTPSESAGKLPLPDIAAMNEFVEQSKILVGALGCDLFRESFRRESAGAATADASSPPRASMEGVDFTFAGEGYDARLLVSRSGELVIRAGSRARRNEAASIPKNAATLRAALQERGVLEAKGDSLEFKDDVPVSSVSVAGAVVCGMSVNGRTAWKTADGKSYSEWEATEGGTSMPLLATFSQD